MSYKEIKIADLMGFLEMNGFSFDVEQVYNLLISLKTKPFVIISGISGTGKSKIIELIAEQLSESCHYQDNYELVAVKPNWTDSKGIFGYHNIIDNTYSITPTIKLFIRAMSNPDKPYFLVLDEMNLARVEHYFSDFLSLLESRRYKIDHIMPEDPKLTNKFFDELKLRFSNVITLSQAIILSAIEDEKKEFKTIQYYRDKPISKWWFDNFSTGSNLQAQFRTELNQDRNVSEIIKEDLKGDGSRLAGRAFLCKEEGNSYKLKDESVMDEDTLQQYLHIKNNYEQAKKTVSGSGFSQSSRYITQEKILLHSSSEILKTSYEQKGYSELSKNDNEILYFENNGYYVPSEIEIPTNVFIVGTVNIDETTYNFSPKVLDRSNVIEFNDVDLYRTYEYGSQTKELSIPTEEIILDFTIDLPTRADTILVTKKYSETFDKLVKIFLTLKKYNKHFGYRVFNEISRYIINFCDAKTKSDNSVDALDIQVLQKILPKLNGSAEELEKLVLELIVICEEERLQMSRVRLLQMKSELSLQGFTTFLK